MSDCKETQVRSGEGPYIDVAFALHSSRLSDVGTMTSLASACGACSAARAASYGAAEVWSRYLEG